MASEISTEANAPLHLGIVGCSLARPRYGAAIALSERIRVTALIDPDTRFARAWSRTLGGDIELLPNLQSLLAGDTIPRALIIDVPLSERASTILTAIPVCRGLLCAPPFAPTLEETDRILHSAAANNTWLVAAFPRRFDPVLAHAIEIAHSGEVGLIQQVRCDWSFPLSRVYGLEIGADTDAGTWDPLLQYAGCHAADVCRWCYGDVLTVSADIDSHEVTAVPRGRRDTSPLLANFVLSHENGPATCHFARSRAVLPSERYTFTGSKGNLEAVVSSSTVPPDAFPALTRHRPGCRPQIMPPPEFAGSELPAQAHRMRAMLSEFADLIQSGTVPRDSGAAARAALEIVHAAYLSARDGRKITLPLRRSPAFPNES